MRGRQWNVNMREPNHTDIVSREFDFRTDNKIAAGVNTLVKKPDRSRIKRKSLLQLVGNDGVG